MIDYVEHRVLELLKATVHWVATMDRLSDALTDDSVGWGRRSSLEVSQLGARGSVEYQARQCGLDQERVTQAILDEYNRP